MRLRLPRIWTVKLDLNWSNFALVSQRLAFPFPRFRLLS
jgi:hypothetical protein